MIRGAGANTKGPPTFTTLPALHTLSRARLRAVGNFVIRLAIDVSVMVNQTWRGGLDEPAILASKAVDTRGGTF